MSIKAYNSRKFCLEQCFSLAPTLIVRYLIKYYTKTLPQGQGPYPASIYDAQYPQQLSIICCYMLYVWALFKINYLCASIITVAIGMYEPKDWPPVFGQLKDAYTVRQFWGTVYHQFTRKAWSAYSIYLSRDVFGFKKGSFGSNYTQLIVAFILTYIYHVHASLLLLGRDSGEFAFFFGQILAIVVEDQVIKAAKNLGIRGHAPAWRILGCLWTFGCLMYSIRPYANGACINGMWL
jgi:hypothetical protein